VFEAADLLHFFKPAISGSVEEEEEKKQKKILFSIEKHTQKRQIVNNDFTLWKAARKVKRPSTLATYEKY